MSAASRAAHLADAISHFSFLAPASPLQLLDWLTSELGHPAALDAFQPIGGTWRRAHALSPMLHIVAGNTPAAALQSLVRGLLLGAQNYCKLPSEGLPEVDAFLRKLPGNLTSRVECGLTLPDAWITAARAIIVFGSDDTLADIHSRVRPHQKFLPHGHRISIGIAFDDPNALSALDAARTIARFDQLGCLSPQVIYAAPDPARYAERLASAMAAVDRECSRQPIPLDDALRIRTLREETRFRIANGAPCLLWESHASTSWTVIFTSEPAFPASPLLRTIFVKPVPRDWSSEFATVSPHLACAGIVPWSAAHFSQLAGLGFTRICPLNTMQLPPWTWRQDGRATLAELVQWTDADGPDLVTESAPSHFAGG
jgi:hypothetical protein